MISTKQLIYKTLTQLYYSATAPLLHPIANVL